MAPHAPAALQQLMGGSASLPTLWAFVTTLLALAAVAQQLMPRHWLRSAKGTVTRLLERLDPYSMYEIKEFSGSLPDALYEHCTAYLSGKGNADVHRLLASLPRNSSKITFALAKEATTVDAYSGATFWWTHIIDARAGNIVSMQQVVHDETRSFQLKVRRKHANLVPQYLAHIKVEAARVQAESRELQVFSNVAGKMGRHMGKLWDSQPFVHPASFATLMLEPELKQKVMRRLDRFRDDGDFYKKTGRAHKLGLLLYGPPGTGKTSMVAAIADHMQYSIYDLDLSGVQSNTELRMLLAQTSNRAVIVLEDIDTVGMPERSGAASTSEATQEQAWPASVHARQFRPSRGGPAGPRPERAEERRAQRSATDEPREAGKLTLGGVLNFADGLRSACVSEMIFIYTSNHPEALDPALLRPGRCDLHICLSYSSFQVCKDLCKSYLGLTQHELLPRIQQLISEQGVNITPAEVTGVLDMNRDDAGAAMQQLVERLEGLGQQQRQQRQEQSMPQKASAAAAVSAQVAAS